MIECPEIKREQPQDRKTILETLSPPVAKILSPVERQEPAKELLVFVTKPEDPFLTKELKKSSPIE